MAAAITGGDVVLLEAPGSTISARPRAALREAGVERRAERAGGLRVAARQRRCTAST